MATLDWSQCQAVESVPGRRGGAWVFRDTRTPVSVVFDNREAGASIDEIMEWFHLSWDQVVAVIEFTSRSLDGPAAPVRALPADAHSVVCQRVSDETGNWGCGSKGSRVP